MRAWESAEPVILAHRAGAGTYPENSRAAFAAMAEAGFTYVETDVHACASGELVLMHDEDLSRTTNGSGPITAKTWDEVKRLKDLSGEAPLRLVEALDTFPDLTFNVDVKSVGAVAPMIRLLQRTGATDRVLVASFSEARLAPIRQAVPSVRTSLGVAGVARLVAASRLARSRWSRRVLPGQGRTIALAQVPEVFGRVPVVTARFLDIAHHLGIGVHVWTVNEASDMARLLDLGVDGLVTDVPERARAVIEARKRRTEALG